MKELIIDYSPASGNAPAKVRVGFRAAPTQREQYSKEVDFTFTITDQERRQIQWYLEDYLVYPWGEFRQRAAQTEDLMDRLGDELFRAVFGEESTRAMYAKVENDLPDTRVVIYADDPEGISLPWELMRDPNREEYGCLAKLASCFVRSQPTLAFTPPQVEDTGKFNILLVISRPGDQTMLPFRQLPGRYWSYSARTATE